jgi:transcriptional regulator with XRE-family HTH domain
MSTDRGDLSHDPLIRAFATLLRAHREAAGLSRTQLADALGCSPQWIEKLEMLKKSPSEPTAIDLDTHFKAPDTFHTLWKLIKDRGKRVALPPWFQQWVDTEQVADVLRNWEPLNIPGLLQTPEYARVIMAGEPGITDESLEQRVASRMERQAILTREDPVLFRALIDESVLHRLVGSPQIMRDQLAALVETAQQRNISVQIVPTGTLCTAGLSGAFWIASIAGTTDTVYLEGATVGRVSDDPREVAEIQNRFDALHAEALNPGASIDLMSKVMEDKWPQI